MKDETTVEPNSEVYLTRGGVGLCMRSFLPPADGSSGGAAIIFFFGGGWTGGSIGQFFPQARQLAKLGIVASCAEYRIFSKHGTTPFEAVSDAKAAVRWLRMNAGRFGFSPEKIAAAGGSAGGHLAACTAMVPGFEEEAVMSSRPDALVLFNPVLDTSERGFGLEKVTLERKTEISPCHHVQPGLPPTLVMHGDADTVAPYENAVRFEREMKQAGNDCRLVSYPGRQHGFFNRRETPEGVRDRDFQNTLEETVAFLRRIDFLE